MSLEDDFKSTRKGMLNHEHKKIDLGNARVMKAIETTDPKFAKHMFLRNKLVQSIAMRATGGIELLDQPVCEHCERPALWDKGGTAYCFSCHGKTLKPITVERYLMEYTKFFTKEQLELLGKAGEEVEIIK